MATNPLYNLGAVPFSQDPYQVKALRGHLQAAGLWDPSWDAWAAYQGGGDDTIAAPATPDFSSLSGYAAAGGDYGGGNRWGGVVDQAGGVVSGAPYTYDEPALFQGQDLAQAAALVGGGALGMNALFGGLGGAAAGAGEALGTLGTIAPGAAPVAPLSTMGAAAVPTIGAAGAAGGAGGLLSSLTSANGLANLGSAAIGLYGQNQALGAMGDATNQANEFNRYAFDTIRADNKPLVDMRNSVLPQIQGLLSNPSSVMNDPGNQFQFAQGQKALANSAAGQGMTYSGAQGKALQRYGQDFASTKLDDSLRRLQSVAGLGQVGSNSNNAATANYAANGAGNALQQGSARGSAYGNMAGIANNALLNIFDQNQFRNLWGGGP